MPAAKKTAAAKKTTAKGAPAARRAPAAGKSPARSGAPASSADLEAVFSRLKGLLSQHAPRLTVVHEKPDIYYLNSSKPFKGKDLFFGAVQVKKSYVSFHLFPLYLHPELKDGLSPELKKRMQGKTCFNFTRVEEPLLDELVALTRRGFDTFAKEGLV